VSNLQLEVRPIGYSTVFPIQLSTSALALRQRPGGVALSPAWAYALATTGKHQWASVADASNRSDAATLSGAVSGEICRRVCVTEAYNAKGQMIASNVADLHGDRQRDRNNIQRATGMQGATRFPAISTTS
jgi:hypothetical protein